LPVEVVAGITMMDVAPLTTEVVTGTTMADVAGVTMVVDTSVVKMVSALWVWVGLISVETEGVGVKVQM